MRTRSRSSYARISPTLLSLHMHSARPSDVTETTATCLTNGGQNARKILHVVGGMNRGGVETWLMRVFRQIDRSRFQFHFLVHTEKEAAYDAEIRNLGGKIHSCPSPRNLPVYRCRFKAVLDAEGPFDVVHSHVYLYSGFVLKIAAEAGVPVRIAHVHTNPRHSTMDVSRRIYRRIMTAMIGRYSTHMVGVSRACALQLERGTGKSAQVVYCGLEFAGFSKAQARGSARMQLNIPADRRVVGHVGRFTRVKNHQFLLQVFERLLARGLSAHLLLVGDGPLRGDVERRVQSRGIADRVSFTGVQDDVVSFLSAMDVFVFPSLWEGLPVAVLEAQAAGVPAVISAGLTEEMDVIPGLIERIPLRSGAESWALAVQHRLANRTPVGGLGALQASNFALQASIDSLACIYAESRQPSPKAETLTCHP